MRLEKLIIYFINRGCIGKWYNEEKEKGNMDLVDLTTSLLTQLILTFFVLIFFLYYTILSKVYKCPVGLELPAGAITIKKGEIRGVRRL